MARDTEIRFIVKLDEKNLPEKIEWEATDGGFEGLKEANTVMISLWDKAEKVTFGIDLWTKEMLVDDMNIHFLQILEKLADTYKNSTGNAEVAEMITGFSREFANKLKLIKE